MKLDRLHALLEFLKEIPVDHQDGLYIWVKDAEPEIRQLLARYALLKEENHRLIENRTEIKWSGDVGRNF